MSKKFADLHIHSTFSDGTLSPSEIIKKANKEGLAAIAITDHDCVDAIEPALKEAALYGIEVIPAVELSCEYKSNEVHILGYIIDYKDIWFRDRLKKLCQIRIDRVGKIVEKLKLYGVDIDTDHIFKLSGCGSVGRLHIAQAMQEKGYVSNLKVAFDKYIGDKAPCYVGNFKLTPEDCIEMINKIGGISILAHPGTLDTDELLKRLIGCGLRGIEVYHPDHRQSDIVNYLKLATRYKLLITGGSDFHGTRKEGVPLGSTKIPYELLEKLKDARQT